MFKKFLISLLGIVLLTQTAFAVSVSTPTAVRKSGSNWIPILSAYEWGSNANRWAKIWTVDLDVSGTFTFGGVIGAGGLDMNGTCLILDADGDTSVCADTDDQIDVELSGADDFRFTANTFSVLAGSTLALADDAPATLGGIFSCLWETADANANMTVCTLGAEAGATDVAGLAIGDTSAAGADLGLFNGITSPFLAALSDDALKALYWLHNDTNGVIQTTSGDINLVPAGNNVNFGDDVFTSWGASGDFNCTYETADANANIYVCSAPESSATNVPGLILGDATIVGADLGFFNGFTYPFFAVLTDDGTGYGLMSHNGSNVEFFDNIGGYQFSRATLTSGGTSDFGTLMVTTLNDSGAAGGSDTFTAIGANVTTTNTTGWDNLYFLDFKDDLVSRFRVNMNGNLTQTSAVGASNVFNAATATTVLFRFQENSNPAGGINASYISNHLAVSVDDEVGNVLILTNVANDALDHDLGVLTNPTLAIFSATAPTVTNNYNGLLSHNGTNFVISAGANTGAGSAPATVNNGISFEPQTLTSGGTADFAVSITRTLNDSAAAGGADLFTGLLVDITTTDTTGWDNYYLMDIKEDSTTKFRIATSSINTGTDVDVNMSAGGRLYGGGIQCNQRAIPANTAVSLDENDCILSVTSGVDATDEVMTLPEAANNLGMFVTIQVVADGGDNVDIARTGADVIDETGDLGNTAVECQDVGDFIILQAVANDTWITIKNAGCTLT